MRKNWIAGGLVALAAGAAVQEDRPARSVVRGGVVTTDTWNVRYCEFLTVTGSPSRYEAEVWSTLGLDSCDPAAFRAVDADALKRRLGVLAVFKNGPRVWLVSALSSPERSPPAPVEDFEGIAARLVGVVKVTPAMRLGPAAYLPTTVPRDTGYAYAKGRPVFVLDDPDGAPWVMLSYSQSVDPGLGLDDLPGLAARLHLPPGLRYRQAVLDRHLTMQPVDGSARIVQDDLENTYAQCFATACSHLP